MGADTYMVTSGSIGAGYGYDIESFKHRYNQLANYGAVATRCVEEAMAMAVQLLGDDPGHPDVLIRARQDCPGLDRPVAYLFGGE